MDARFDVKIERPQNPNSSQHVTLWASSRGQSVVSRASSSSSHFKSITMFDVYLVQLVLKLQQVNSNILIINHLTILIT